MRTKYILLGEIMRYQLILGMNHCAVTKAVQIRAQNYTEVKKRAKKCERRMNRGQYWTDQWRIIRIDEILLVESTRTIATVNPRSGKLVSSQYLRKIKAGF